MRLIDANELRDRLQNLSYDDWNQGVSTSWAEAYSEIADMVDEMLTIDAEPIRHGKWIKVGDNTYRCSQCNEVSCCNGNFCTDCGARMDCE